MPPQLVSQVLVVRRAGSLAKCAIWSDVSSVVEVLAMVRVLHESSVRGLVGVSPVRMLGLVSVRGLFGGP